VGLFYKLFFAPAVLLVLYVFILGQRDFVTQVTLLEAAMATMITSAVVAAEFSLDEELANLMVGVSVPLSLCTVSVWNQFLSYVL
jgi:predicted permease